MKIRILTISSLLVLFFSTTSIVAQKSTSQIVENNEQLTAAIASAKPNTTIIMKNGEWKNTTIDFNSKNATADAPITIKAETGGKVKLNGSSSLTFSSPYLKVDGLLFDDGAISKYAVIGFNSDYCTLTNTAIVDYNPSSNDVKYYWVYFKGNHNFMNHCYFKGKSNSSPLIGNNFDGAKYNKVSYCHIKDIPYAKENGREIFRIWGAGKLAGPSPDGAFFTVEYNLLDHADGEGVEIISLKSNHDTVRFNTIRACMGGMTSRQGNNNTFEGNFILGEKRAGSKGIRVAGENHHVFNNYISDVEEDGLQIMAGEYVDEALSPKFKPAHGDPISGGGEGAPRYRQVKNGVFENNTIINAEEIGINIGSSYLKHWPEFQMVLMPENNIIRNNLVVNAGKNGVSITTQDKSNSLSKFNFVANTYTTNLIDGKGISAEGTISGFISANAKMEAGKDGIYRPKSGSAAIDAGTPNSISTDLDGQPRDKKVDIGADEQGKAPIKNHPLSPKEVGPNWMIVQ